MTDWQPMETAPTDGTTIDVFQNGCRVTDVFWSDIQGWWCIEDREYGRTEPVPLPVGPKPSHWRPVPEPPNDQ